MNIRVKRYKTLRTSCPTTKSLFSGIVLKQQTCVCVCLCIFLVMMEDHHFSFFFIRSYPAWPLLLTLLWPWCRSSCGSSVWPLSPSLFLMLSLFLAQPTWLTRVLHYSSVREREMRGPFLISFLFSSFLLLFCSSRRSFWNASAVWSTWKKR